MRQKRHVSKAAHNYNFVEYLYANSDDYNDWIVAGIFYSAMHYIDAVFARDGKHLKNHDHADKEVSQHKELSKIYSEYRTLKDYRWRASYWATDFKKSGIDEQLMPKLKSIKEFTCSLLSKPTSQARKQ